MRGRIRFRNTVPQSSVLRFLHVCYNTTSWECFRCSTTRFTTMPFANGFKQQRTHLQLSQPFYHQTLYSPWDSPHVMSRHPDTCETGPDTCQTSILKTTRVLPHLGLSCHGMNTSRQFFTQVFFRKVTLEVISISESLVRHTATSLSQLSRWIRMDPGGSQ